MAEEEKKKENEYSQDEINRAMRQKLEKEMTLYESQSNQILDDVRKVGVSVDTRGGKKKRPEMISDIHILFSRQKPEFVVEGVDTSDALAEELGQNLEDKIEEKKKKKKEETNSSSSSSSS